MAFTESTANFGLPQWQPNDKPTYLVDKNQAYRIIDTQMQANKVSAESAVTSATTALSTAQDAVTASNANAQNIVNLTNTVTAQNIQIFVNRSGSETNPNPAKIEWYFLTVKYMLFQTSTEKHGIISVFQNMGLTGPNTITKEDIDISITLKNNNWSINPIWYQLELVTRGTKQSEPFLSVFLNNFNNATLTNGILHVPGTAVESTTTLTGKPSVCRRIDLMF